MKILVGLGNPGEKYKYNRHNIGFSVLDEIAVKYSQTTWVKKFLGKFCQCRSEGKKFLLLKPETFMNNSGHSVTAILAFYKLNISDLIVLHDDLDLNVGQVKIKQKGGHAGHNGIKSIHQALGDQYTRIRIGIGHPGNRTEVSSYVLSDFSKSDNVKIDPFIKDCVSNINELISGNYSNFSTAKNLEQHTTLQNMESQPELNKSYSHYSRTQPIVSPKNNSFSILKSIIKKLN
jgi:PTH1 family peptidyl-tRNA hydrolase